MTISALDLPPDVINCISEYLDVRDYTYFSQTNWKFYGDLQAAGNARKCIQKHLRFSQDGQRDFSKARKRGFRARLSEVFDTKEALRTARPYSVSTLAYATSFVYENGILAYSTRNSIRVLDLHSANATEKVISARFFSQKVAVPGESASAPALQLSSITLLGYSNSILTLTCNFGATKRCFLFAINISDGSSRQRCLLNYRLRDNDQLFAVHDSDYLYCGSPLARGRHGYHEWLLQGFKLSTGEKITDQPVQLDDFAGSDLGSSVTFAIHNGYFHALSNQTSHESEEVNWTSYYHQVSFPAGDKDPSRKIQALYRRQDIEGPINDAWTDLGFQIDHETGELLIVECRKEWIGGAGSAVRTYYVQPWNRAYHDDWEGENTVNPSDPVRMTVTEKDQARYETAPHLRVEKYTHTEFAAGNAERRQEYLRAKTKWHGYDFNNQCYVDLVVDEVGDEGSWRKKERIRLRVVSRLPDSPLQRTGGEITANRSYRIRPQTLDRYGERVKDSEDVFKESEVYMWPRDGTEASRELDEIMCPGGRAGEVKAQIGEEGIVYMAGPSGYSGGGGDASERALIFMSFEPSWGFEGMRRLDGELVRPRQKKVTNTKTEPCPKRKADVQQNNNDAKKQKTADVKSQLTNASSVASAMESTANPPTATASLPPERLLWMEKARYLSVCKGYWLR